MKDNKNMVFALHSYTTNSKNLYFNDSIKEDLIFTQQGFLLFQDESKAETFLSLCERFNSRKKLCDYSKYGYIEVSDYIANRVDTQQNFYVKKLSDANDNLPNEIEVSATA